MSDDITVEIKQESVQKIIAAKVNAAVMEALVPHQKALVEKLVEAALCTESTDNEYRYDHGKKPSVIEHMVLKIIREEAQKGIQEWAESRREEIAASIRASLSTKKYGRSIAMSIAENLANCEKWHFRVAVSPVASD